MQNIELKFLENRTLLAVSSQVPQYDYCHIPNGNSSVNATLLVVETGNTYDSLESAFDGSPGAQNVIYFNVQNELKEREYLRMFVQYENTQPLQYEFWAIDLQQQASLWIGDAILGTLGVLIVVGSFMVVCG